MLSTIFTLNKINDQGRNFMCTRTIELPAKGITLNHGGPFGCVIVKGDEIVGRGNNRVTSSRS